MGNPYSVRIAVRTYELDALGHVNQAVYHSYAEHARVELMRAAGCGVDRMIGLGAAPVLLASQIRYLSELRAGDEVDVSAEIAFGTGKTFTIDSVITKRDGTVSAEIGCTIGLLDLSDTAPVTQVPPREDDDAVRAGRVGDPFLDALDRWAGSAPGLAEATALEDLRDEWDR